jgi:hypothetical protein
MQTSHRVMTVVAALIVAAGSLSAQNAVVGDQQAIAQTPAVASMGAQSVVSAPANDEAVSLAPFAENASVGIHAQPANAPAPYAPVRRDDHDHVGHNTLLMIVGGAALVTGAIIAGSASTSAARGVGDVVMISGAVVGIIGLIRYLH